MTCNELGGACEHKFEAETFKEIAELSKKHGMKMFQQGDKAHLKAMAQMRKLFGTPEALQAWYKQKEVVFNSLPED